MRGKNVYANKFCIIAIILLFNDEGTVELCDGVNKTCLLMKLAKSGFVSP